MYSIPYFKAENQQEVMEFMSAHPFAVVCGSDETGQAVASHLPLLMEEREGKLFLLGHCMKKQAHTEAFAANPRVLIIFSGAHSYVSASWYENKETASTWNYQAVHVNGILRFQDEKALHKVLSRLTEKFEAPDSPSLVARMDSVYVEQMMKAIVAFEIEVKSIEHVFKLSQNRDAHSYENIIAHLRQLDPGAQEIARVMSGKKKN